MPTLAKPRLQDPTPRLLESIVQIEKELNADSDRILELLNFYAEYDLSNGSNVVGHKFEFEIRNARAEVMSVILAALTEAVCYAFVSSNSVVLATLKKVVKDPSLVLQQDFPADIAGIVAAHIQRRNQLPAEFSYDVLMEFHSRVLKTVSTDDITAAASEAISNIGKKNRLPGRPVNPAIEILSHRLAPLFRRFNKAQITRISSETIKGRNITQSETGAFHEFVEAVIRPLNKISRANDLPYLGASGIVNHAMEEQPNK